MVSNKLSIAASMVKLGSHVLWEKISSHSCICADQIPVRAEAITPEWLTDAICRNVPGAKVLAAQCSGGSDGSSSRRSIDVTYNDIGCEAGLPDKLFAKSTPHLTSRLTLGPSGKLAGEIGFYNNVRPLLDIEATRALYAAYDPPSARSMILFEDLAKFRGCTFCDPTVHIDRAKAEHMVSLLARYHGRMWNSPLLDKVPTTLQFQNRVNHTMAFAKRAFLGIDRAASVIPATLKNIDQEALWQGHMRSLEINASAPLTLTHWDMHIGNWYITRDGRMGLSDWGMLRGQWAADYTYALVSALTVEDRRAWESDLLRLYLERLAEAGGEAPSYDAACLAVRQQAFHPLFYWLVTIGAGPLQADMQPDHISLKNLERMAAAFVDFEAMRSL